MESRSAKSPGKRAPEVEAVGSPKLKVGHPQVSFRLDDETVKPKSVDDLIIFSTQPDLISFSPDGQSNSRVLSPAGGGEVDLLMFSPLHSPLLSSFSSSVAGQASLRSGDGIAATLSPTGLDSLPASSSMSAVKKTSPVPDLHVQRSSLLSPLSEQLTLASPVTAQAPLPEEAPTALLLMIISYDAAQTAELAGANNHEEVEASFTLLKAALNNIIMDRLLRVYVFGGGKIVAPISPDQRKTFGAGVKMGRDSLLDKVSDVKDRLRLTGIAPNYSPVPSKEDMGVPPHPPVPDSFTPSTAICGENIWAVIETLQKWNFNDCFILDLVDAAKTRNGASSSSGARSLSGIYNTAENGRYANGERFSTAFVRLAKYCSLEERKGGLGIAMLDPSYRALVGLFAVEQARIEGQTADSVLRRIVFSAPSFNQGGPSKGDDIFGAAGPIGLNLSVYTDDETGNPIPHMNFGFGDALTLPQALLLCHYEMKREAPRVMLVALMLHCVFSTINVELLLKTLLSGTIPSATQSGSTPIIASVIMPLAERQSRSDEHIGGIVNPKLTARGTTGGVALPLFSKAQSAGSGAGGGGGGGGGGGAGGGGDDDDDILDEYLVLIAGNYIVFVLGPVDWDWLMCLLRILCSTWSGIWLMTPQHNNMQRGQQRASERPGADLTRFGLPAQAGQAGGIGNSRQHKGASYNLLVLVASSSL